MIKRYWPLALGIVTFTLVFIVSFWALQSRKAAPVRMDRFDQIKIGMTPSRVHAIVGCPPDDYRTFKLSAPPVLTTVGPKMWYRVEDWHTNAGTIHVGYEYEGGVSFACLRDGASVV
jgi:hypothetical protein